MSGRVRVLSLMIADAFCVIAVWMVCVLGYRAVGIGDYEPSRYLRLWPILPLFLAVNLFARTYQGNWIYPSMPLSPVEEFRRLFLSAMASHLTLAAALAFTRTNEDFSRFLILAAGLLIAFLAQPMRDFVRAVLKRLEIGQISVLLVGEGEAADRVADELARDGYHGLAVRRFNGDVRDIVPEARSLGIRTLIACQDERLFRVQLGEFVKWFRHIEYMPTAKAFPTADGRAISIGGIGGLEMVNQTRMKAMHVEKRVLDTVLAAMAFVLLLPFFILIPVLIKCCCGKGPVFYRANRLGKFGRSIRVWKFRSMYADADARLKSILDADPKLKAEFEANFKLANDPRVTPLGKFLRKTSLDEIPQLFNVFAGDMALVGPRPIVTAEIPYYGEAFEIFSSVKPGITGLWQCSGRSDTDYARRVALDVHYVLNWSPWMDLWIVVRTAIAVLTMKGAC